MPFHTVNLSRKVEIFLEEGSLAILGGICKNAVTGRKAFIISDSNVAPLYSKKAADILNSSGFNTQTFAFDAGEERKRLSTIEKIYEAMFLSGITRTDIIVALGGGVVGDMAGYAAATYLRGIKYIQVPTTLLSQIDSSIGGKTGVDMPFGKNLVGAVYQPFAVLIDPSFLNTLPEFYFKDGLCEIIKYAYIKDSTIYEDLKNVPENLSKMIRKSVLIKSTVVENDEFEKGERMLLNFGHTFGHAIEKCMDFKNIGHGEAVAKGMYISLKIGENLGLTEKGETDRYLKLCEKLNLDPYTNIPSDKLFSAISGDKKKHGDTLNFILIEKMGKGFIYKTTVKKLQEVFKREFDI